jgi:hypothetical protein
MSLKARGFLANGYVLLIAMTACAGGATPDVAQSPRIMYPGGARGRQIATCWEGFSPAEIATTPHLKCRIRTQIISIKDSH